MIDQVNDPDDRGFTPSVIDIGGLDEARMSFIGDLEQDCGAIVQCPAIMLDPSPSVVDIEPLPSACAIGMEDNPNIISRSSSSAMNTPEVVNKARLTSQEEELCLKDCCHSSSKAKEKTDGVSAESMPEAGKSTSCSDIVEPCFESESAEIATHPSPNDGGDRVHNLASCGSTAVFPAVVNQAEKNHTEGVYTTDNHNAFGARVSKKLEIEYANCHVLETTSSAKSNSVDPAAESDQASHAIMPRSEIATANSNSCDTGAEEETPVHALLQRSPQPGRSINPQRENGVCGATAGSQKISDATPTMASEKAFKSMTKPARSSRAKPMLQTLEEAPLLIPSLVRGSEAVYSQSASSSACGDRCCDKSTKAIDDCGTGDVLEDHMPHTTEANFDPMSTHRPSLARDTATNLSPGFLPVTLEDSYRKRTSNICDNSVAKIVGDSNQMLEVLKKRRMKHRESLVTELAAKYDGNSCNSGKKRPASGGANIGSCSLASTPGALARTPSDNSNFSNLNRSCGFRDTPEASSSLGVNTPSEGSNTSRAETKDQLRNTSEGEENAGKVSCEDEETTVSTKTMTQEKARANSSVRGIAARFDSKSKSNFLSVPDAVLHRSQKRVTKIIPKKAKTISNFDDTTRGSINRSPVRILRTNSGSSVILQDKTTETEKSTEVGSNVCLLSSGNIRSSWRNDMSDEISPRPADAADPVGRWYEEDGASHHVDNTVSDERSREIPAHVQQFHMAG